MSRTMRSLSACKTLIFIVEDGSKLQSQNYYFIMTVYKELTALSIELRESLPTCIDGELEKQ